MSLSQVLDIAALGALANLQRPGKPDITALVIGLFRDETPAAIKVIAEGVAAADLEAVRLAAHSVKSSAAYVGARVLSGACAQLEVSARDGNLPECVVLSDSLESLFSQSLSALDDIDLKAA